MEIIIIFGVLDWLILVFDFWKSNIRYPKWLHPKKLKDDFDSEWIVKKLLHKYWKNKIIASCISVLCFNLKAHNF